MPSSPSGKNEITLSVVVPVFDEVMTIREILRRVDRIEISKEIIVVDDGSTDGTTRVLEQVRRQWKNEEHPNSVLHVIVQPENRGKGAVVRSGIARANGRITLIQDADLEYDPRDYARLIEPILEGYADVVYGSRFIGSPRRVLYFRHSIGNRLLTTMSNFLTDLNLTDMETCYKAFRTDLLKAIPLREDRFGFEPEVTAKVARLGLRVYEVPISYRGRSYAEGKKIGWRDGVDAVRVMLRCWAHDEVADSAVGRRTLEIMKKSGRYNRWLFEQIRPYLGERVLEVGSGIGNLSHLMLDREQLVLTDIDPEYRRGLEEAFGSFENVTVSAFDLNEAPSPALIDAEVDTVLCCNVLEHIEDDGAALRNLSLILRPGGRLVLLVPAHPAAYGSLDVALEHHRRYEKKGLHDLFRGAGLEVEHERHLNAVSLLPWLFNSRLLRRKVLPRRQVGLVDLLVPWLDLEQKVGVPAGLSLLLVGRRPA
ncbi:MAG: glycosyltransferase [Myxococcota bacterium]